MSNVHGLYSNRGRNSGEDSDDEKDESNNRYVGGIGDRGGGSGLAVEPNTNEGRGGSGGGSNSSRRDMVFGLAQHEDGTSGGDGGEDEDAGEQVRRTITMYRDGFTVDDGPYRRLDDPDNAEFLRALAMGRTPRELAHDAEGPSGSGGSGGGGNIVVGLVDKRSEDYVETFRSFSGAGASLGTTVASDGGALVFDPATLSDPLPAAEEENMTSVAVRLPNGTRQIVKIAVSATVAALASLVRDHADGTPFRLATGFPPRALNDPSATIEAAGLKGAQVSMQEA